MISTRRSAILKRLGRWAAGLSVLGLVIYPIIIQPMIDPTYYKEMQKIGRAGIDQEKIQPGNMRVWSDPFTSRK